MLGYAYQISPYQVTPCSQVKHYVLRLNSNNQIFLETKGFETVSALVQYYLMSKEPIKKMTVLKTPVPKQDWEIEHSQVELTKKLGEGAFGEVWKGRITLKNGKVEDVAIKSVRCSALLQSEMSSSGKTGVTEQRANQGNHA